MCLELLISDPLENEPEKPNESTQDVQGGDNVILGINQGEYCGRVDYKAEKALNHENSKISLDVIGAHAIG